MTNVVKRNFAQERRSLPYKLDLQMFAESDPAEPQDPPAAPKKLELTQEEFDAKIAERLARERKKYADYDEVKTKLSDYEKAEEQRKLAELSETQRLEAEKAEALKKAEAAEGKAQSTIDAANKRLIKAEFRLLAKEAGVRADALDDAYVLADLTSVNVDDDGNVNGVKNVIDALVKAKPFLAEPPVKEPKQIGQRSGSGEQKTEKTKEQLLKEAADKARKSGRIEDRVAYAELKHELGL